MLYRLHILQLMFKDLLIAVFNAAQLHCAQKDFPSIEFPYLNF